jgi:protein-S-isoprenylcysteine O-methyltransferase Ste14
MSVRTTQLFAVLCYLIALSGAGAFALFVLLSGCGWWPFPPLGEVSFPWLLNLAWLLLFALQHSGMARERFKTAWTRIVPSSLERSVYAAVSGLVLLLLPLFWQSLPGAVWWDLPRGIVAVPILAGIGLAAINATFDHTGLFGLRQAWAGDAPAPSESLIVSGPYRYIRHPLMACLLVFLWAQPRMTPGLGLLAVGLTTYIALGLVLEERDLLRRFGSAYAAYRRRVPALVPWREPAPANSTEEAR